MKAHENTHLGTSGNGSELRVKVGGVGELVHGEGAEVVQQGVLVHRVFHLRHFRQVVYVEPFTLKKKKETKKKKKTRRSKLQKIIWWSKKQEP